MDEDENPVINEGLTRSGRLMTIGKNNESSDSVIAEKLNAAATKSGQASHSESRHLKKNKKEKGQDWLPPFGFPPPKVNVQLVLREQRPRTPIYIYEPIMIPTEVLISPLNTD